MEGLNERLYEPNNPNEVIPSAHPCSIYHRLNQSNMEHESSDIDAMPQFGFEGMNRVGKSIEELAEDKPKKTYIGPSQASVGVATSTGSQPKQNKKQEWKAAQDPGTGLTYYYHLKTREVSYMHCALTLSFYLPQLTM